MHYLKRQIVLPVLLFLISLFVIGCQGSTGPAGPVGPAGPAGPAGLPGPQGEPATASQTYVGAEVCGDCHDNEFAKFTLSGHANALFRIADEQPPVFPYDAETGGIAEPPPGYTWADIGYVIGGFSRMARFTDTDGFILTGDTEAATQLNYANRRLDTDVEWVGYHAGEENIPFDCGQCHTTGYQTQGHQDGMSGIEGSWAFAGVQCEVCHGPGSRHATDPMGVQMVVERSSQLCGDCHAVDNPAHIDAEDGFERHQLQFEDLYNSKHFALDCIACHDPHASAAYADEDVNPTAGIQQVCESCHWQGEIQKNDRHGTVDCVDCHMPPMAKVAVGNLELFTADMRSHQFSINPNPEAPQFTEDGSRVMPYITLAYACQQCHNGEFGSERTLDELAEMAQGYHQLPTPTPEPLPTPTVEPTPTP